MAFDRAVFADKLKQFKIRNVRSEGSFDLKTKRILAEEVLVPVNGKLLLNCTDERQIKQVIDPKTGQEIELGSLIPVRAVGAGFGLVDAIRNVRVTLRRGEILDALREHDVLIANHVDTHAEEGKLTGCGQGALREMPESASIFDRPAVNLNKRMQEYEQAGVLRIVLEGEHLAQGMLVNPFSDRVLDPTIEQAEHSFFALDLGVYRDILRWISGALGLNDEVIREMLVKLTRNNLAAVFILSNGEINEVVYIERNDEGDVYYAGILHEALAEFKDREGPVLRVLEERGVGTNLKKEGVGEEQENHKSK